MWPGWEGVRQRAEGASASRALGQHGADCLVRLHGQAVVERCGRGWRTNPPERPRRMLAHERLVVLERAHEHVQVVRRPTLPSTTAALRVNPRSLARFIGEPLNAAENSGCVICRISRAKVLASFPATTSRGACGESSGSSEAKRTFHGHTSWESWRYNHVRISLGTGARTLSRGGSELHLPRIAAPRRSVQTL